MEFYAEILNIIDETHDVKTFRLKRPKELKFKPGQYCLVGIDDVHFSGESRPFTFSSSSLADDYFELTIKKIGEFTGRMFKLNVGDKLLIKGPMDSRLAFDETIKYIVFIAGGSGITPFMSAIRYVKDKDLNNEIILFYSNKTRQDIIYKKELDSFDKIKVVYPLTDENPDGKTGRIDILMIKNHLGDLSKYSYYLCGPPGMVNGLKTSLIEEDIPEQNVFFEDWQIPGKGG